MEKEETLNKEDQNLKDENSDLSKDQQAPDETGKKEEDEQLLPEDVSKMVLFLASEVSLGCTKQNFTVDAGLI